MKCGFRIFSSCLCYIYTKYAETTCYNTILFIYNNEKIGHKNNIEVIHGQSRMKILYYRTDNKYTIYNT